MSSGQNTDSSVLSRHDLSQDRGPPRASRVRDISRFPEQGFVCEDGERQGFLGGVGNAEILMCEQLARANALGQHAAQRRILRAAATQDDLKCATLAWHTLHAALERHAADKNAGTAASGAAQQPTVSTE